MPGLPTPVLPKRLPPAPHPPASALHVSPRLIEAVGAEGDAVLRSLDTSTAGLSAAEALRRYREFGPNVVSRQASRPNLRLLGKALVNPLVILLLGIAAASFVSGDVRAGVIVLLMVLLGVVLRFAQEARAGAAAAKLQAMISVHATVLSATASPRRSRSATWSPGTWCGWRPAT